MSYLSNGHLDTPVDWMLGMNDIQLKYIRSFIHTTDPEHIMPDFFLHETSRSTRATTVILNTYSDLKRSVLDAVVPILPPIYTIGLVHLLSKQTSTSSMACMGLNLWKKDQSCLMWLDTKARKSVMYVNFGSITVMLNNQLIKFAWGLCNSNKDFSWIIRPNLVKGEAAVLPKAFSEATKERGMLVDWCSQEHVLANLAVSGFLTHSGWNSTLESICAGVPMLCWPFFAEQLTNCRYCCVEWGVCMEINDDVKREEVTSLIMEMMDGVKGKEIRMKAEEWRVSAIAAAQEGGS